MGVGSVLLSFGGGVAGVGVGSVLLSFGGGLAGVGVGSVLLSATSCARVCGARARAVRASGLARSACVVMVVVVCACVLYMRACVRAGDGGLGQPLHQDAISAAAAAGGGGAGSRRYAAARARMAPDGRRPPPRPRVCPDGVYRRDVCVRASAQTAPASVFAAPWHGLVGGGVNDGHCLTVGS